MMSDFDLVGFAKALGTVPIGEWSRGYNHGSFLYRTDLPSFSVSLLALSRSGSFNPYDRSITSKDIDEVRLTLETEGCDDSLRSISGEYDGEKLSYAMGGIQGALQKELLAYTKLIQDIEERADEEFERRKSEVKKNFFEGIEKFVDEGFGEK